MVNSREAKSCFQQLTHMQTEYKKLTRIADENGSVILYTGIGVQLYNWYSYLPAQSGRPDKSQI